MKFIEKYKKLIFLLFVVIWLFCLVLIFKGYSDLAMGIIAFIVSIYVFVLIIHDCKVLDDIAAKKNKDGDEHE